MFHYYKILLVFICAIFTSFSMDLKDGGLYQIVSKSQVKQAMEARDYLKIPTNVYEGEMTIQWGQNDRNYSRQLWKVNEKSGVYQITSYLHNDKKSLDCSPNHLFHNVTLVETHPSIHKDYENQLWNINFKEKFFINSKEVGAYQIISPKYGYAITCCQTNPKIDVLAANVKRYDVDDSDDQLWYFYPSHLSL